LLNKDKLIFVLRLVQAKLQSQDQVVHHFNSLMKSCSLLETTLSQETLLKGKLSLHQLKQLEEISQQPEFSTLLKHITTNQEEWVSFLEADRPEDQLPKNIFPSTL
jgi:hypothetical protein